MNERTDVHARTPVLATGAALDQAKAAVVMIHGRGASAQDILSITQEFTAPDVAFLAPQAAGHTWYPQSFTAPIEANEPYLSSALAKIDSIMQQLKDTGIPADKIMLLGFSQGACLASEYVARNPRRYGGLAVLSGGLIGPEGVPLSYEYEGENPLDNTPVFLGCSNVDFHIPVERVHESTAVLREMGGQVEERIYPNMGHTINQDEIDYIQSMLDRL
jgi:phospholipase/carboxylesterase